MVGTFCDLGVVYFCQIGVLEVFEASGASQVAGEALFVVHVGFFVEHQVFVGRLGEVVDCNLAEERILLLADLLDPVGYGSLHRGSRLPHRLFIVIIQHS